MLARPPLIWPLVAIGALVAQVGLADLDLRVAMAAGWLMSVVLAVFWVGREPPVRAGWEPLDPESLLASQPLHVTPAPGGTGALRAMTVAGGLAALIYGVALATWLLLAGPTPVAGGALREQLRGHEHLASALALALAAALGGLGGAACRWRDGRQLFCFDDRLALTSCGRGRIWELERCDAALRSRAEGDVLFLDVRDADGELLRVVPTTWLGPIALEGMIVSLEMFDAVIDACGRAQAPRLARALAAGESIALPASRPLELRADGVVLGEALVAWDRLACSIKRTTIGMEVRIGRLGLPSNDAKLDAHGETPLVLPALVRLMSAG